jgi:hypothetical protein
MNSVYNIGGHMEKQEIITKTKDALTPFETENIVKFIKGLSVTTVMGNPWILGILVIVLFYAIIKRSKFVLLSLFTIVSLMFLIQYTLPESGEFTLSTLLPFVGGGLVIGMVLIYFTFIKTE